MSLDKLVSFYRLSVVNMPLPAAVWAQFIMQVFWGEGRVPKVNVISQVILVSKWLRSHVLAFGRRQYGRSFLATAGLLFGPYFILVVFILLRPMPVWCVFRCFANSVASVVDVNSGRRTFSAGTRWRYAASGVMRAAFIFWRPTCGHARHHLLAVADLHRSRSTNRSV